MPRDDGAAPGLVPLSRSIQAKGLGRHYRLFLPSAHLIPRGWELAQLDHIFPHFQNPTALSPQEMSLWQRGFVWVPEEKGKKQQGLWGMGRLAREEEQPRTRLNPS